ncbi:MAG TPA: SIS domain-containing protein [Candidatus Lumbricidophila sp.]|nr:SIS domain-containing protein [Candidatus Lumbricidophila sp.]
MTNLFQQFSNGVSSRLAAIDDFASAGGLDAAVDLMVASIEHGGVLHAFGTGHSAAFAMEIAGRAGGLIPTHRISLDDLVMYGGRDASFLDGGLVERDPSIVDDLYGLYNVQPADLFLIASNSGVNGSVVGTALRAKADGHKVIAVTSLEHTNGVTPKHPSGKRLSEIADVVIDNVAPYGDATLELGEGVSVGAVSSITAAYIAQLLTIATAARLSAPGAPAPVYISANIPEGDAHNRALEARYAGRIKW